jgi:hypothetical protein
MTNDASVHVSIGNRTPPDCWRQERGEACESDHQTWHECMRSYADHVLSDDAHVAELPEATRARLYAANEATRADTPRDIVLARRMHDVCVVVLDRLRRPTGSRREPSAADLVQITAGSSVWMRDLAEGLVAEGLRFRDFEKIRAL